MNLRTTWLLLAAVLLLGGFIWFAERHAPTTSERRADARRAFLFRPRDIRAITIAHDDLDLHCVRERGDWFLRSPVRDRADSAAIERFLHYLELLRKTTVITARQREEHGTTLADYGLDPPIATFELESASGKQTYQIGHLARLGEKVYVRRKGHDAVFPVDYRLLQLIPSTTGEWRAHELFPDGLEQIARFAIRRPDGFIQIARENTDRWTIQQPIPARAGRLPVQQLLTQLENFGIEAFVADEIGDPAAYGLEAPVAELLLWADADASPRSLLIGKRAPEPPDTRYARWSGQETVYAVSQDLLALLQTPLQTLRDRRLTPLFAPTVRHVRLTRDETEIDLRRDEQGHWRMKRPYRQKADAETVERLVENWVATPILDFVADRATNLKAYALAPPQATIHLATYVPTNDVPVPGTLSHRADILVGQRTTEALYVACSRDSVYAIDPAALDATSFEPLHYRHRLALEVPPTSVLRITLEQEGTRQVVARSSARELFRSQDPGQGVADQNAIDALLRILEALRVRRYVIRHAPDPARYGLDTPRASLSLHLTGDQGIAKTLLIGQATDQQTRYAILRGDDTVFEIEEIIVDVLTHGLLAPPETRP